MTPDPHLEILGLVNGYQVTQAIHVAVILGVPDRLKDGPRTSDELAAWSEAHPDALYRLLRALAAVGVLHEGHERCFSLTAVGDCLRSDSADSVGGWAALVGRPYMWQAWGHLLHSVRTGENAFADLNGGKSVWQYRAEHPAENEIFNLAMTALSGGAVAALLKGYDFSRFRHIADIGGGQGQAIAGILAANPDMRGTLFDQPHVVTKAKLMLAGAALDHRCDVVAGNFFESVPAGADAYMLRVVLHDWNDEEAISILKVCRQAITAAARLLIVERVIAPPNEGFPGKFSDLNMLVSPGGRERTREQFADLCDAARFKLVGVTAAGPRLSVIEAEPY